MGEVVTLPPGPILDGLPWYSPRLKPLERGATVARRIALGVGGSAPVIPIGANVFNWDPDTQFTNARAAYASMRAGTGQFVMPFLGDSITAGVSGNGTTVGNVPGGFPFYAAAELASFGVPITINSFCGNQNATGSADPRVALVGGASFGGATIGGACVYAPSAGDGANFTPAVPVYVDRIRIVTFNYATVSWDVGVNGGALTGSPLVAAGALGMVSKTFSIPRTLVTTINARAVGGAGFLGGVSVYDSTAPTIQTLVGGLWGATAPVNMNGNIGAADPSPLVAMQAWGANLCIFMHGTNDGQNDETKAVFKTANENGIQKMQAMGCDVIAIVTPPNQVGTPMESAVGNGPLWNQYRDALEELAVVYNFPVYDMHAEWVSWAIQNAKVPSWEYDGLHPAAPGHQSFGETIIAPLIYNALGL